MQNRQRLCGLENPDRRPKLQAAQKNHENRKTWADTEENQILAADEVRTPFGDKKKWIYSREWNSTRHDPKMNNFSIAIRNTICRTTEVTILPYSFGY
jgi:hypothetical protein